MGLTAPFASGLSELYSAIETLAAKVGLDPASLPRESRKRQEDGLWLEQTSDARTFVRLYQERGVESAVSRGDFESALFDALYDAAQQEASRNELRQRLDGPDPRRALFLLHEDLMAAMRPEWRAQARDRHSRVLADYPFRDES